VDKSGKEIKRSDGALGRNVKSADTENVEVRRIGGKAGNQKKLAGE
jgi:hypothetical protein